MPKDTTVQRGALAAPLFSFSASQLLSWRLCRLAAVLCVIGSSLQLLAAPSFRADRPYPALGLKMRVLGTSEPAPLPPPQVYTCTIHRSDGTESKLDLLSPGELWIASQCVGRWVDKSGNELLIGKPTALPLPDGIGTEVNFGNGSRRLVSREEFTEELEKAEKKFGETINGDEIGTEWIAAFTGDKVSQLEKLKTSFNLAYAAFVPVENRNTLIWLFRTKARGNTKDPVFCAVVKIADGTAASKVRKDFETQFLAHVSSLYSTGGPGAKMGQNVFGAKQTEQTDSSPARDAALASIENMKGWWHADAKGYVILSDLRSKDGKSLVRWMQQNMPAFHQKLEELVPPAGEKRDLNIVRIFEDRDAYKRYLSGEIEWSIGCWVPMRRELVINWMGDKGKAQETLSIIRHEGTHQYLFYALQQSDLSLWYNEGHACFMECASIDNRGKATFRPKESSRYAYLKRHLDEATSKLDRCIFSDRSAFYGGTDQSRSLNYATAWGLIWYLRMGLPKNSPYSSLLDTYRDNVLKTKDGAAATRAAFADVSMPELKEAFKSYWLRH
ncbi:MAG: DUF1570 domain-containing protein [Kiritimatiellae bacterium]|nr:DUF1570 domain-containing protein [Kiritimatiellia bacterium]